MIRFERMREEEFSGFIDRLHRDYARDHTAAGNWSPEESLRLAREEIDRLLPAGQESPNQFVRKVVNEAGLPVGNVWYALQDWGGIPRVWVFWIGVNEDQRRHGTGRAILRIVEEEARRLGARGVALHVFSANAAARALYEGTGYKVASLLLKKDLPG